MRLAILSGELIGDVEFIDENSGGPSVRLSKAHVEYYGSVQINFASGVVRTNHVQFILARRGGGENPFTTCSYKDIASVDIC
jgi:hypothetical protein